MQKYRVAVAISLMVMAMAITMLSGCSSSGETSADAQAQVATLSTSAAEKSTEQQPAKKEPPRERLDMTAEEIEALMVPYFTCLKDSGFTDQLQWKKAADRSHSSSGSESGSAKQKKEAAAYRACEEQYLPLPPWEKDPANPEAADFAREVTQCMKQKGVKDAGVDADGQVEMDSGRGISMGEAMEISAQCERETAARK